MALYRDGEVVAGTAADGEGFYVLRRVPPGVYLLRCSFVGYRMFEDSLSLGPGEDRIRAVLLEEAAGWLDEVVVNAAGREEAMPAAAAGFSQSATAVEIEVIPAPDVSGDLANFLAVQPGIVTQGDRGGQFFVQGGDPTHNLVLLDGMPVYQPFHLVGSYSAFSTEIINQVDVYGAGFGARYGGHLSSVVDVTTRGGNKARFGGAVSAAPFVSGARIEGPLIPGRVSFLASVRESVIERAAEHLTRRALPFHFGDRFAKVHAVTTEHSLLSFTALQTYDRGTLGTAESSTAEELNWESSAAGLRYLFLPTSLPMRAQVAASYSHLESTFGVPTAGRRSAVRQISADASATVYAGLIDVHWGAFVRTYLLDYALTGLFQNYEAGRDNVTEAGFFVAPELVVGRSLHLAAGLRVNGFPSKGRAFVEPRLLGYWQVGRGRLYGAAGIYHQQLVGLTDKRDPTNVFTVWTASPVGEVPRAIHLTGGYSLKPVSWIEASFELYTKTLRNLQVAEWTPYPSFTPRLEPVDGEATGAEVRLKLQRPAFYAYAAYGFSKVLYDASRQRLSQWYGALRYAPPHDRRHQIHLVVAGTVLGFDLGMRWQFGSGLPYSRPLGFDEFILMNRAVDPYTEPGARRILYGVPYNSRLPTYHRLDLSVERTFSWKRAAVTVHGSLLNVYDRANLLYLDLYTARRVDQLPLFPSLGLKVEMR